MGAAARMWMSVLASLPAAARMSASISLVAMSAAALWAIASRKTDAAACQRWWVARQAPKRRTRAANPSNVAWASCLVLTAPVWTLMSARSTTVVAHITARIVRARTSAPAPKATPLVPTHATARTSTSVPKTTVAARKDARTSLAASSAHVLRE